MTPILTAGAPPLREAFYALSMAQRIPDAELLDDVVRRYPIYANELTEFAIELALDALRGRRCGRRRRSRARSRAGKPGRLARHEPVSQPSPRDPVPQQRRTNRRDRSRPHQIRSRR